MRVGSKQIKSEYRLISVANETLYQLSYTPVQLRNGGINVTTTALSTFFAQANTLAAGRASARHGSVSRRAVLAAASASASSVETGAGSIFASVLSKDFIASVTEFKVAASSRKS
jgi:hypothetical protein